MVVPVYRLGAFSSDCPMLLYRLGVNYTHAVLNDRPYHIALIVLVSNSGLGIYKKCSFIDFTKASWKPADRNM